MAVKITGEPSPEHPYLAYTRAKSLLFVVSNNKASILVPGRASSFTAGELVDPSDYTLTRLSEPVTLENI